MSIIIRTRLESGIELILRDPEKEDASAILDYLRTVGGESDNLLFGKDGVPFTIAQEENLIQEMNRDEGSFMVIGEVKGEIVSLANLVTPKRARIAHNAEIALSVRKDHWNHGVGRAVMTELIDFARRHPGIHNVHLGVKKENEGAIHLYEKMGFVRTGSHKDYFQIDGVFYDLVLMDMSPVR
jgi:RimJ/RimL family protein N-acetyltransferase